MRKPAMGQVCIIKWNFCIDHMLVVFDTECMDRIDCELWS